MNGFRPDSPEALLGYLEGALSPEQSGAVRARLIADPELRAEFEALKEIDAALHALADAPAWDDAPDLVADVLRQVQAPQASRMMAALEGDLSPADSAALEDALAADAELRAEMDALRAMDAELLALAETLPEHEAEPPDLVAGVMAQVRGGAPNVVPFPSRRAAPPTRPATRVSVGGVWAAAACLVLGCVGLLALVLGASNGTDDERTGVERHAAAPQTAPVASAPVEEAAPRGTPEAAPDPALLAVNDSVEGEPAGDASSRRVTLEDALRARREAMFSDQDSLSRLAALASLTEEEAKSLLETAGISTDALLGAAQFLSDEDARLLLTALIEKNPEDPYLRMALALRAEPGTMLGQAEAWQALDPGNALPYYLQAQAHFAQGNAVDGLAALAMANGLGAGSMYSDDAAQQRERMLVASGMDSDAAQLVAASTAGYWEGQAIYGLSTDLYSQGQAYEAAGDYESAEQVYEAMRTMGAQMAEGALYAQERMAAMNAQSQAILALQQIYELLQQPESLAVLGTLAAELVDGLNALDAQLGALNNAFQNDASNIANLAGFILTNGDLFVGLF
jgi:anti-sigma factor RsiW